MRRALAITLLLALLGALAVSGGACGGSEDDGGGVLAQPVDSRESFAEVQPFAFQECRGAQVTNASLAGHAWAACFVFTRCSGPCPKVTATMKRLQSELHDADVRLVSITVDPRFDTPAVLAQYAELVGADPRRWLFLSGDEATTYAWIRASFLSGTERDDAAPEGERVTHRTSIVAVDKRGRVRGFYEGESSAQVELLRDRLEWLQRE